MDPRVSVLLTTYNQRDFCRDAVLSAVNQDYSNLEVVISDDGSTDGTVQVLKELKREFPNRIQLFVDQPHLGLTKNCNRALQACRGDLIAFHAGDDLYLPGKIAAQVRWFGVDSQRVVCGHQVEVFYQKSDTIHPLTRYMRCGRGPAEWIKHGGLFGGVSTMLRRDHVPPSGFDERVPHVSDTLFVIETLAAGGEFGYIDGTFARYRKHDNNTTNRWRDCVSEAEKVFSIVEQKYPQYRRYCAEGRVNIVEYGLAMASLKEGNLTDAGSAFAKIILRHPKHWRSMVRLAQCGLLSGRRALQAFAF